MERGPALWCSKDSFVGYIFGTAQPTRVVRLEGVPDEVDVLQPNGRVEIGAHASENVAESEGRKSCWRGRSRSIRKRTSGA